MNPGLIVGIMNNSLGILHKTLFFSTCPKSQGRIMLDSGLPTEVRTMEGEKRQRTSALHDATAHHCTARNSARSWSAPVLWRFAARKLRVPIKPAGILLFEISDLFRIFLSGIPATP